MNQLFAETKLANQPKQEEPDRRYRILVLLQRSDRPTHWVFKCPHCATDLVEVNNAVIEALSDLVSMETPDNVTIGMRCDGRYCHYWYYFKLGGM
jgi:uncharacterized protein with PIN domain